MDINTIRSQTVPSIQKLQPETKPESTTKPIGTTFEQALESLGQSQSNSDLLIEKLAAGENVDVHQVMIASEETDINFRIALAIRDKLVDSYREVMRMSV